MTHINEDKRKTEGQLVMFNIFNDIDNCPVSLLLTIYATYIYIVLNGPRNSYFIYRIYSNVRRKFFPRFI
jgi:hypothetical protein